MESALAPYQPQAQSNKSNDNGINFDLLLQLLSEVDDEELVLAATQVEAQTEDQNTKKTSVMARTVSQKKNTTFTGCTFRSVGTINIHIHKH